jgi:hypothetical protein
MDATIRLQPAGAVLVSEANLVCGLLWIINDRNDDELGAVIGHRTC